MKRPYDEIAHLYDSEFSSQEDVYFYLNYLPFPPCCLLEIGCGTGRVAIPLAQKGYKVIGIDISLPMLKQAKKKQRALPFFLICMDMRRLGFKKRFTSILMPFGVLHFLTSTKERIFFLRQLHSLLAPRGKILIDLFNPYRLIPNEKYLQKEFVYAKAGTLVTKQSKETYTDNKIIVEQTYQEYEYGASTPLHTYHNRLTLAIIEPQTLEKELLQAGFWIEEMFGDYLQNPFSLYTSPRLLVVAAVL